VFVYFFGLICIEVKVKDEMEIAAPPKKDAIDLKLQKAIKNKKKRQRYRANKKKKRMQPELERIQLQQKYKNSLNQFKNKRSGSRLKQQVKVNDILKNLGVTDPVLKQQIKQGLKSKILDLEKN
jgi:hypothetical protein